MKSRRDAYLVIHLCYFIIAAEFLFDQSIGAASYSVLSMVIVTAALVGLHQLHTRVRVSTSLRTAAVLVMQAMGRRSREISGAGGDNTLTVFAVLGGVKRTISESPGSICGASLPSRPLQPDTPS